MSSSVRPSVSIAVYVSGFASSTRANSSLLSVYLILMEQYFYNKNYISFSEFKSLLCLVKIKQEEMLKVANDTENLREQILQLKSLIDLRYQRLERSDIR